MKRLVLFTTLFYFASKNTCAQPGKIDSSFGVNGTVTTNIQSLPGLTQYKSIAMQPDGKLLALGSTNINSNYSLVLARYNIDGSLDKSFSDDGKVTTDSIISNSIAIQKDGKILVAGSAPTLYSGSDNSFSGGKLARYNIDGSLDKSFSGGIVTVDSIYFTSLAIQNDGKIVLAGFFGDSDPDIQSQDFAIVRFNTNGTLDSSFSQDGKTITNIASNDYASSVAIQSDGKILVGGNSYGNYKDYWNELTLARYNIDGVLDTSFNKNGIVFKDKGENRGSISLIVLQKDGKIVFADGTELERYNYDGSLDNNFAVAGKLETPLSGLYSINIQGDGKFLVAGFEPTGSNFAVARYDPDGNLDTSFNETGIQETKITQHPGTITSSALANDKIYLAGFDDYYPYSQGGSGVIVRYSQANYLDSSYGIKGVVKTDFGSNRGSTDYTATAIQKDGKIVVVGTTFNDTTTDVAIVRYNTNGSLDTTFSNDGKQVTSFDTAIYCNVRSVAIQNDGKIVVVGDITTAYLNQSIAVIRYNPDGSLDKTFGNGGKKTNNFRIGGYVQANEVAIQKDGKIVVAGTIDDSIAVIRYSINGTLDTTFDKDGKQTTLVDNSSIGNSVAIQTDGKILIAGTSAIAESQTTYHFTIVRYNIDGSLDKTFSDDGIQRSPFDYEDFAYSIALQADGKILIAGNSSHYDNYYKYGYILVRYNSDGTIDSTFGNNGKQVSYDEYTEAFATSVGVENNGNILVGGYVVKDGKTDLGFTNYYSNGKVNPNFDSEPKETSDVDNIFSKQLGIANGKFYFVGTNSSQFGIVSRYFLDENMAPTISLIAPGNNAIYSAPATITLNATASDSDGTITSVQFYNGSTLIKVDSTSPYNDTLTNLPAGNYSFVAKAIDNNGLVSNSATVAVTILLSPNKGPDVSIINPVNNATYIEPASITINATASDPDGTIANVKFYNGSTLLATDSISPNSYTINNALAGNYKFYVQATDNKRLTNSSSTVSAFVVPGSANKAPTVSITSPKNNTNYPAIATIVLHANASDTDGTISSVQFYNGSTLIKTDSSSPYSCTIAHPPTGNYSFVAKAIDNNGLISNSATINVSVGSSVNKAPVVSISSPGNNSTYLASSTIILNAAASDVDGTVTNVKFFNGATFLKTVTSGNYIDTLNNIAAGSYKFYAKATDNNGLTNSSATVSVFVVPGTSNKAPVVKLINPANNAIHYAPGTIFMSATASDQDGTIANVKFYMGSTLLSIDSIPPYSYTLTNLPVGNYSFVAKATDNNGLISNSSTAVVPVLAPPNKAPIVNITSPLNNATYEAPATITLNATASDSDGTITNVKFYNGLTFLKTVSKSPYSYTLNNLPAGNYKFYAKATDNLGLTNSTASIYVVVTGGASKARVSVTATKESVVKSRPSVINIKTDLNGAVSLRLAPNPVHNILNIYATGLQQNKQAIVSIISASGVVMKKIQTTNSSQAIQLNVSSLASGLYIIKMASADKVIFRQFVKL